MRGKGQGNRGGGEELMYVPSAAVLLFSLCDNCDIFYCDIATYLLTVIL